MGVDNFRRRPEEWDFLNQFIPAIRMRLHDSSFIRREFFRFSKNGIRNSHFSYVVQQGSTRCMTKIYQRSGWILCLTIAAQPDRSGKMTQPKERGFWLTSSVCGGNVRGSVR